METLIAAVPERESSTSERENTYKRRVFLFFYSPIMIFIYINLLFMNDVSNLLRLPNNW